jgi:hypothetical protein
MASKSIGMLTIVFGADLRGFDKAMKKAQKNLKKFGNNLKRTGKNLSTNLTLPIMALGVVSVKAFDKQQKAIAQVEAGLKSTGNQVGLTSKELQKMAADLQKTTLFGDEEILQGATAQLLTFTNIAGEQFKRTQEVALDLATRLDGDLKSASIMLGKALNDPVANLSALSRAGIQFSTEQKAVVKSLVETNRLADAQTIILEELEKQYGGSAEAAAAAGLGPIQQLGNTLSDMSEDIGAILLPVIQDLANWIKKIADKFDNLEDSTKKTIVVIALVAAALGPALMIIGQMSIGISALIGVFTTLNAVMAANPIGVIVVAIAALVGAFYWLITSSSDTARQIRNFFTFMANGVIMSINKIIEAINLINPFKQIKPIKLFSYETKKELKQVEDGAKDAAKEITNLAKGLEGGGVTTTEGGGGGTGGAMPTEPMPIIGLSLMPTELPDFKPYGDLTRNEFEKISNDIEAQWEESSMTMEEQTAYTMGVMIENFMEFGNKVKQVMSGIGDVISATNEKEQAQFDIWRESQEEKTDILDEEMEKELERVEVSNMSDEEKAAKKIAIEERYAEKKGEIDAMIDKKEKAMKRKQAIRDKAMAIASAIISTAEAVAANIAFPPLAALIGALGAVQIATIASTPIPFAQGGLVTGPTLGLIGEGSGTSAFNPEVVSPLDKLMGMMGGGSVDVHGRIKGENIVLVSDKAEISRERFI